MIKVSGFQIWHDGKPIPAGFFVYLESGEAHLCTIASDGSFFKWHGKGVKIERV